MFSGRMDDDILRRAVRKIRESRRIDAGEKERLKAELAAFSRAPRSY
jgi:hypothetical protein